MRRCTRSRRDPAPEFVLDVLPDDLVHAGVGFEAQLLGARRGEALRPVGNDFWMIASGSQRMRAVTSCRLRAPALPPSRPRCRCAGEVDVTRGAQRLARQLHGLDQAWTTRRGERMYIAASRPTGQTACWPASGSRKIELAQVEAALLGLPGRTQMVGRRRERPSSRPLRWKSATSSSPMAFWAP